MRAQIHYKYTHTPIIYTHKHSITFALKKRCSRAVVEMATLLDICQKPFMDPFRNEFDQTKLISRTPPIQKLKPIPSIRLHHFIRIHHTTKKKIRLTKSPQPILSTCKHLHSFSSYMRLSSGTNDIKFVNDRSYQCRKQSQNYYESK